MPLTTSEMLDAPSAQPGSTVHIAPPMAYTFTKLKASSNSSLASMGSLIQGRAPVNDPGLRLAWYVNDTLAGLGGQLPATKYKAGDKIELRLERQTATDIDVLDVARQTILNSPPVLRRVLLRQPQNEPNFIEAIVDGSDADEDELTVEYRWTRNGTRDGSVQGDRYPLGELESGDRIEVTATLLDRKSRSESLTSDPFALLNHSPTMEVGTTVSLDRSGEQTMASLKIQVNDPDGDSVQVELQGAPAGVRWDNASQSVQWPVGKTLASFTAKLVAVDSRGSRIERDIQLGTNPPAKDGER